MTEEEKAAYNNGYSEGYRVGRQWAKRRLEGNVLGSLDLWIIGAVSFLVTLSVINVARSFGYL